MNLSNKDGIIPDDGIPDGSVPHGGNPNGRLPNGGTYNNICNEVFISVSMCCLSSYMSYQSCHVRLGLPR